MMWHWTIFAFLLKVLSITLCDAVMGNFSPSSSFQDDSYSSRIVPTFQNNILKTSTITIKDPDDQMKDNKGLKVTESVFIPSTKNDSDKEQTTKLSLDDTSVVMETSLDVHVTQSSITMERETITLSQGIIKHTSDNRSEHYVQTDDSLNVEEGTTTSTAEKITLMSANDSCKTFGTCRFLSLVPNQFRFCKCDSHCTVYGDCCLDSYFSVDQLQKTELFKCASLEKSGFLSKVGIFLIDRCPDDMVNIETNIKCNQNIILSGPYVADGNGTIYKNKFCAECNNVLDYTLFEIEIKSVSEEYLKQSYIDLTPMEQLSIFLSDPNVDYKLIPPSGIEGRSCVIYSEPSINESLSCSDYVINPIFGHNRNSNAMEIMRNVFCKKHHLDPFCLGGYLTRYRKYIVYSLSVLFSFSQEDDVCSSEQKKIGELCTHVPMYRNSTVTLIFRLISTTSLPVSTTIQVLNGLMYSLSLNNTVITFASSRNVTTNSSYSVLAHVVIMRLLMPLTGDMILLYRAEFSNFKWRMNILTQPDKEFVHVCLENLEIDMIEFEQHPILRNYNNINGNSAQLKQDMLINQVYVNGSSIHDTVLCSDVVVDSLFVDQELLLQKTTCQREILFQDSPEDVYTVKLIITYTGCSVSVFALGISVVLSRKFATTESIPGNNLENLSIAIGLSNVLFMIGVGANDYQRMCYVIGVVIHYLWLVTFSFMTISVTYICRNLTKMVSNTCHDGGTLFSRKSLLTSVGLFVPIMFVLPSVLLDYFGVPYFSAIYSGLVCFPTGFLSNLIFVSVPISLSICINLTALIIIIVHVTRHSLKINHVKRSQSFQQGRVYVRLCAFTGIFWITGILSEIFQSSEIELVFIILGSLQGLCIAVANLTTKRMCRKFNDNASTE